MEIVYYPHPALRRKSSPVTRINAALKSTVREMFELMYEAQGVGLAANQVALPFRFFIMNLSGDPTVTDEEFVFLNPEITNRSGTVEAEEGCLSVPQLYGQVKRVESLTVSAYDLDGNEFELDLDDLPGRVIQHENDHLDGIMFFDRMSDTDRRELEPQIDEFETIFRHRQSTGERDSDEELVRQLAHLECNGLGG